MSPALSAEPQASVILCAYTEKRWEDLCSAIASVKAQTVQAREVIVVIDNNERLFARVRRLLGSVTAMHNTGVPGAGESRNRGVGAASGEIVAFLDDDASAEPDWIENAIGAFASPRTLGVGGQIDPAWQGKPPRWMAREFYWTVGCTYPGLPTTRAPVRNLIAANMFVRRDAFLELGGFRAGFGKTGLRSGTEETELCIRAAQRWPDRVWLHDPAVMVSHHVPSARSRPGYFISRCYDEGVAKASVVGFVGKHDGLAAERAYTRRTLPLGFLGGIRSALLAGEPAGLARSLSILIGLAAAGIGYLVGRLSARMPSSQRGADPGRV